MRKTKAILMAAMIMPPAGPVARVINHENDDPNLLQPDRKIEMNLRSIDSLSQRKDPQRFVPWGDVP